MNRSLLIAGTLLAFLGLALGAFLPLFTNPRMALAAHQQGIVAGVLLITFGLAWPRAALDGRRARATGRLLNVGAYALWTGSVLAALCGTSRATPIAGAGFAGTRWQELSVSLILILGSVASLSGVGFVLLGLIRARRASGPMSER